MSTSVDIWFPTYIGDFFTVTASMTGHEVGAYQLILAQLWKAGGAIKADDRQLAKLVKANPRQWKEIKEALWPLFEIKGGDLTHPETTAEIQKARALVEKKRGAAIARWTSERNAKAMHVHTIRTAGGMPRAGEGGGEGGPSHDDPSGDEISEKPFRVVEGGAK